MAVPFTTRATEAIYLHSKELYDTISTNVSIVAVFGSRGRIQMIDGGLGWRERVFYGTNANSGHASRYEQIGTERLENMTMASYDKAFFRTAIVVNKVDVAEAKGEAAQGDLVKDSWEIAKADAVEQIATALWATSQVSADYPIPLPIFLPATLAASQTGTTRGGISSTDNSWWRSYAYTTSVDFGTAANLVYLFNAINQVSRGSAIASQPDFGITTSAVWSKLASAHDAYKQYKSDEEMARIGFANIKVGPMTVLWDKKCTAKAFYMINSRAMKIKCMRMPNMQNIESKGNQKSLPMVIEPMRDDIDTVNMVSLMYLPYALVASDLGSCGMLSNCTE